MKGINIGILLVQTSLHEENKLNHFTISKSTYLPRNLLKLDCVAPLKTDPRQKDTQFLLMLNFFLKYFLFKKGTYVNLYMTCVM